MVSYLIHFVCFFSHLFYYSLSWQINCCVCCRTAFRISTEIESSNNKKPHYSVVPLICVEFSFEFRLCFTYSFLFLFCTIPNDSKINKNLFSISTQLSFCLLFSPPITIYVPLLIVITMQNNNHPFYAIPTRSSHDRMIIACALCNAPFIVFGRLFTLGVNYIQRLCSYEPKEMPCKCLIVCIIYWDYLLWLSMSHIQCYRPRVTDKTDWVSLYWFFFSLSFSSVFVWSESHPIGFVCHNDWKFLILQKFRAICCFTKSKTTSRFPNSMKLIECISKESGMNIWVTKMDWMRFHLETRTTFSLHEFNILVVSECARVCVFVFIFHFEVNTPLQNSAVSLPRYGHIEPMQSKKNMVKQSR